MTENSWPKNNGHHKCKIKCNNGKRVKKKKENRMAFNFLQPTHIKNEDKALLLFIFINFPAKKIKHKKFEEYKTKANLKLQCVHMLNSERIFSCK